jgi:hypothetical protein
LASIGIQVAHGSVKDIWQLTPLEIMGKQVIPADAGL